ncbi:phage antirepressor [Zhihengliuella halotolerans]|uniref:phage antirepressor n=1 Tax=Zhihengliuella halotolerans TaxID=370736 RepID=UPI0015E13917|nr:BRO family protein [Zhihengliuella halotolerans]
MQGEGGEPWFVAADVAKILGYEKATFMTRRLDEDEKGVRSVHTLGGYQQMTIVSEAGLYSAILGSKVPGAKAFKRWVTHEVLPAIRKTGNYSTAPVPTGPELLALAVVEAQQMIAAKDERIAALEPAADAWAVVCSTAGTLTISDAAKCISDEGGVKIGAGRLIEKLIEWKWVFRPNRGEKTRPVRAHQRRIDQGVLVEKASVYIDRATGEKKLGSDPQTRVTGKGLDAIRDRLLTPQLEVIPGIDTREDCA